MYHATTRAPMSQIQIFIVELCPNHSTRRIRLSNEHQEHLTGRRRGSPVAVVANNIPLLPRITCTYGAATCFWACCRLDKCFTPVPQPIQCRASPFGSLAVPCASIGRSIRRPARVAQRIERHRPKVGVGGSSPSAGTQSTLLRECGPILSTAFQRSDGGRYAASNPGQRSAHHRRHA